MNICYEGAKYMSKKNVILTITQICVISILVGILVVVIIEKIENEKKNEALQRNHGYTYEESEDIKKLREIIENICRTSEYKPYGKPLIMFAEVLGTSEYKTEYPDYEKFISTEDNVWYCTDCSIDEEYIGEYIGTMTSSNKEEYEIYKIKDISSEYAVAFKETEPDCYMGLINTKEYAPENIQDFIADTNLKNSDVEINMTFTEQSQEGYKEESPVQGPTLGNKNEFTND